MHRYAVSIAGLFLVIALLIFAVSCSQTAQQAPTTGAASPVTQPPTGGLVQSNNAPKLAESQALTGKPMAMPSSVPAPAQGGARVKMAMPSRSNEVTRGDVAGAPAPQGMMFKKEKAVMPAEMKGGEKDSSMEREPEGSEGYEAPAENPFMRASDNPISTFSIDVDTASYSNIRRFLSTSAMPPTDAVRLEEMVNYFKYDYPQPKDEHPFSINTEMSDCPWNAGHRLVLVGLQGKKFAAEKLPPSNLIFLIDVSGSMSNANKLPLLKDAFKLLVQQLTPRDKVTLVVYAGAAGVVLPATSGNEKEKILAALDNLQAGGSTAGAQGLLLAYEAALKSFIQDGNNRVILATDGDFNVGVSDDKALVKLIEEKRDKGVFLSILGFGMGNLKDAKMEKMADHGNGNYAYIDTIGEAKKVLVTQMGGTLHTIAKDVKIQILFNPAKVKGYRLLGYENRVLATQDFNDDRKDAGELGAGHTVTALYEVVPAGAKEEIPAPANVQKETEKVDPFKSSELMVVKFRYKKPSWTKSDLIVKPLADSPVSLRAASENLRFAAAVAQFGLLLKGSKYKGVASYDKVLSLAKESKGADLDGYREEFLTLVESAKKADTRK